MTTSWFLLHVALPPALGAIAGVLFALGFARLGAWLLGL